ncbi:hypothetical protein [Candidatus Borrarchaeum sp.]|uniref:hypothetical protein n=1 Tax=Candidatus Borrarchaeum sp. TaxID=2846742 RepID=UPI0025798703|nr:hypothetical protein [Candidatus Borrarchaeum sp.]
MTPFKEEKSIFTISKITVELIGLIAVVIGSLLFVTIVYLTQFIPEFEGGIFFTDIVPVLFGIGATIGSLFASFKIYGYKTLNSKIWLLIALGNLFWALGEFGWFYFEVLLGIDTPYPSFADILWLAGFFPLYVALFKTNQLIKPKLTKKLLVSYCIISVVCILAIILLVIWPIATYPVGEDFAFSEKVTSIIYPVTDIILFLFAMLVLLRFRVAKISWAWFILALSFLIDVFADSWFSIILWEETYVTYHPVDLLWLLSYSLVIVAVIYLRYARSRKFLLRI